MRVRPTAFGLPTAVPTSTTWSHGSVRSLETLRKSPLHYGFQVSLAPEAKLFFFPARLTMVCSSVRFRTGVYVSPSTVVHTSQTTPCLGVKSRDDCFLSACHEADSTLNSEPEGRGVGRIAVTGTTPCGKPGAVPTLHRVTSV